MAVNRSKIRDLGSGVLRTVPTDPGALTINSGDTTPDTTIADVSTAVTGVDGTGSNAASKADVDARLTAIDSNFADLAAQVDALRDAFVNAGLV